MFRSGQVPGASRDIGGLNLAFPMTAELKAIIARTTSDPVE